VKARRSGRHNSSCSSGSWFVRGHEPAVNLARKNWFVDWLELVHELGLDTDIAAS
jgi:hypothetical protein